MMSLKIVAPLAAAVLFLGWFFLFRPLALAGPASYVIVSGKSMEPNLSTGDLVITRGQDSYAVGDVVAYRANGGLIIHRIVGGDAASGFVMQGDNNSFLDIYRPTPDQIAGEQWIHLPSVGRWALKVKEPANLAFVLGIGFAITLQGTAQTKPPRRKRGKQMQINAKKQAGPIILAMPKLGRPQAGLLATLALTTLVCIALATIALNAFTTPTATTGPSVSQGLRHNGSADLTFAMAPSALYPDGTVKRTAADTAEGRAATPVYSQLARKLTVDFAYKLEGPLPADVAGEVRGAVILRAGENEWAQTLQELTPARFTGPIAQAQAAIDLQRLKALIEQVEKETSFRSQKYTIAVRFDVLVDGIARPFSAEFPSTLDGTRIEWPETLAIIDPLQPATQSKRTNEMGIGPLSAPVGQMRWLALIGALVAFLAACTAGAAVYLGVGQSESARIKARYRNMLLPIEHPNGEPRPERAGTRVASMRDLARLARRDGGIIFHEEIVGGFRYFVRDGDDTYEYTVHERPAAPDDGRSLPGGSQP